MPHQVLSDTCVSISDLKENPSVILAQGEGFPVTVVNRNTPDFYCIPAASWEAIVDRLEDVELNAIVDAREGQAAIEVNISDL